MVVTFWGVLIAIAVPAVMAFALYLKRRIPHGEARFDSATGKLIDDE